MSFKEAYLRGFKLSSKANYPQFEEKLIKDGDNYYFYDKGFLQFYLNEPLRDFGFAPCYLRLDYKSQKVEEKYLGFLRNNAFLEIDTFIYMSVKASSKASTPCFAKEEELDDIYDFFISFFDSSWLFYFTKSELLDKIKAKEVISVYKGSFLAGATIFTPSLGGVLIDFIASNKMIKNCAFSMLKSLCDKRLVLFVSEQNTHALSFYKRFGFISSQRRCKYYKKEGT